MVYTASCEIERKDMEFFHITDLNFFGTPVWFLNSNYLTVVVWQQNEITREDFVRGARVIVGDQVLVQTIRQMHQKVSWLSGVL